MKKRTTHITLSSKADGYEIRWRCPLCGRVLIASVEDNHEIALRLTNAQGNQAPRLPKTPTDRRARDLVELATGRPECRWWNYRSAPCRAA